MVPPSYLTYRSLYSFFGFGLIAFKFLRKFNDRTDKDALIRIQPWTSSIFPKFSSNRAPMPVQTQVNTNKSMSHTYKFSKGPFRWAYKWEAYKEGQGAYKKGKRLEDKLLVGCSQVVHELLVVYRQVMFRGCRFLVRRMVGSL